MFFIKEGSKFLFNTAILLLSSRSSLLQYPPLPACKPLHLWYCHIMQIPLEYHTILLKIPSCIIRPVFYDQQLMLCTTNSVSNGWADIEEQPFSQNFGVLNCLFTHLIFFAFPKAQSLQDSSMSIRWSLTALPVTWVITSVGLPGSACRTLMSLCNGCFVNCATQTLSGSALCRNFTWLTNHCKSSFDSLR